MHLVRRIAPLIVVLALAGGLFTAWNASTDPELEARNGELADALAQVEARNRRLTTDIAALKSEISRLRDDDAESVHRARTELGMVRGGEVVYRFEPGRE